MSTEHERLPRHEMMSFEEFESDAEFGPILQEKALEYLKTEDAEYFNREFSGELDSDGYLLKKDGSASNTRPSQQLSGSNMDKVLKMAREEINQHSAS